MLALDASSENATAADPQSFTHTPVGTPRAIVVFIAHETTATDIVVSVTYGGVTMTRIGRESDTTGEVGAGYCYFLGSAIPVGAQSVSVDRTEATTIVWVGCTSWTASRDVGVVEARGTNLGGTNVKGVFLGPFDYGGRSCVGMIGGWSGYGTVTDFLDLSGFTRGNDHDFGVSIGVSSYETAPDKSSKYLGYNAVDSLSGQAIIAFTMSETYAPYPYAVALQQRMR